MLYSKSAAHSAGPLRPCGLLSTARVPALARALPLGLALALGLAIALAGSTPGGAKIDPQRGAKMASWRLGVSWPWTALVALLAALEADLGRSWRELPGGSTGGFLREVFLEVCPTTL